MDFVFQNGDRVKDVISGLTGIITSRSEHLFGCNRYWVQPEESKDLKAEGGGWFDEDSLRLVKAGAIKPRVRVGAIESQPELRKTGGSNLPPSSSSRAQK